MIYVYGDSFVSEHGFGKSWPSMLGEKLNLEISNRGVSGSSTEFSMKKIFEDIEKFKSGDIVIFSFSTTGRIHYREINVNIPQSSCAPWNDGYDQWEWQKENEKYIKWHMKNLDYELLQINFEAYHHLIKFLADSKSEIKIIVMVNTFHDKRYSLKILPTSNYFRLPFDLLSVSNNEYQGCLTYSEFTEYTRYDPRVNHLTIPNMIILRDIVYDFIVSGIRRGSENDFVKQNILKIKNIDQYYDYIDRNVIFKNNEMIKRIKK